MRYFLFVGALAVLSIDCQRAPSSAAQAAAHEAAPNASTPAERACLKLRGFGCALGSDPHCVDAFQLPAAFGADPDCVLDAGRTELAACHVTCEGSDGGAL